MLDFLTKSGLSLANTNNWLADYIAANKSDVAALCVCIKQIEACKKNK